MLIEHSLESLAIARADRVEERRHVRGSAGHVFVQRSPAREAVLARDRELGVGELSAGILGAQLIELLLGGLAIPFEMRTTCTTACRIGTRGLRFGHGGPSFSIRPGVRESRAERRLCFDEKSGGKIPSRGP